ncbi:MAG: hypothetical protein L0387_25295 [Acidobacteria bacterium]|nr:hypothetical protein [Acidobacteriota bacterium]
MQEAVKNARAYFLEVFGDQNITDLRLEEVETSDDGNWLITLGFIRPYEKKPLQGILGDPRDFKLVVVDGHNGKVLAIKIRKV